MRRPRLRAQADCELANGRNDSPHGQKDGSASLRNSPEIAAEPDAVEDRSVLLACVGLPPRVEAVVPPRFREMGELPDRDRCPLRPAPEPAVDVLFRPEEVHRASGVDDVVPPVSRGDEAVEDEAL